ncbi:hypothetical protein [Streptomyces sp. NPDC046261]|uniref:hypothetical protein n=1 Tax=Streptomyces sp. NPDC046261 TaxID=3157200 RepID=UPI0033EE5E58
MKRIAALVTAPVAAALLAVAVTPGHAAATPGTTQASAHSQHAVAPVQAPHRPITTGTLDSSWGG